MSDIAFIGPMGCGKTTASVLLEEERGYERLGFASTIKAIAGILWHTPTRAQLQELGVKVRDIDDDAWVRVCLRIVDEHAEDRVTIDDCRFPNEYWGLKERGFVFVRINADEDSRYDRLVASGRIEDRAQMQHESEKYVADFAADYTIENDSTPEIFADRIRGVANTIERRVA